MSAAPFLFSARSAATRAHLACPGGMQSSALCGLLPLRTAHPCRNPFTSASSRIAKCAKKPYQLADPAGQLGSSSNRSPAASCASSADGSPAAASVTGSVRALEVSLTLWLMCSFPALAADAGDFSQGSASTGSYYATLFLFVATLPGAADAAAFAAKCAGPPLLSATGVTSAAAVVHAPW